jgi:hypothetical protein
MHKRVRLELPGKVLPPLPRHSTSDQSLTYRDDESDAESFISAQNFVVRDLESSHTSNSPASSSYSLSGIRNYLLPNRGLDPSHKRSSSTGSQRTPRASGDLGRSFVLYRETSRVSLRAALRNLLQNDRVAQSSAIREFLTNDPVQLNEEEMADTERRKDLDEKRIREQQQFYEVARARAAELDVHMEKFRRDVVENSMFTQNRELADRCRWLDKTFRRDQAKEDPARPGSGVQEIR